MTLQFPEENTRDYAPDYRRQEEPDGRHRLVIILKGYPTENIYILTDIIAFIKIKTQQLWKI